MDTSVTHSPHVRLHMNFTLLLIGFVRLLTDYQKQYNQQHLKKHSANIIWVECLELQLVSIDLPLCFYFTFRIAEYNAMYYRTNTLHSIQSSVENIVYIVRRD